MLAVLYHYNLLPFVCFLSIISLLYFGLLAQSYLNNFTNWTIV